jgi:hypothetical protein
MKSMRRGSGLVLGLLWLLMAGVVRADTTLPPVGVFETLEGQGVEVCEACLSALEEIASGPDGVGLSGCERDYNSQFGLSEAEWTEIEPLKHLALLRKVMMFLRPVDPELHVGRGLAPLEGTIYENDDTFKHEIKTEMKYERIAIFLAVVDIDNDGRSEPVVKYRRGICGNPQAASPSRALIVLTQDRKSIDRAKTDLVTQSRGKSSRFPTGTDSEKMYDVFSFKGKVYFDSWDRGPDPDIVTVYQAEKKRVTSLCKFRYEARFRSEHFGGRP